jgi:hypothetical protein
MYHKKYKACNAQLAKRQAYGILPIDASARLLQIFATPHIVKIAMVNGHRLHFSPATKTAANRVFAYKSAIQKVR